MSFHSNLWSSSYNIYTIKNKTVGFFLEHKIKDLPAPFINVYGSQNLSIKRKIKNGEKILYSKLQTKTRIFELIYNIDNLQDLNDVNIKNTEIDIINIQVN